MNNKETLEALFEYVNLDEENDIPEVCFALATIVRASDDTELVNLAMNSVRKVLCHYQENCRIKETAHTVVEVHKSLDWSKSRGQG